MTPRIGTPEAPDAHAAVRRAFRSEYGRTVAVLMRSLRDLDAAEDAVQEAFTAAAATWPDQGVPPNPQAWLVTTARRRAIDTLRRQDTARRHLAEATLPVASEPSGELDDELRLLLLCAHPALSPESQVALTLRFVGGLTAAEIARAFGVPEATIAQRLSRAKAKIRAAGIALRLPEPDRWRDRVDVALAVVYAISNEGYLTTAGPLHRPDLTEEAIRLARHLRSLVPGDPEAKGLLALLLLLRSRDPARIGPDGGLVPLPRQDRSRWDRVLIAEGHDLVRECLARGEPGPYQVQAAIQAVHCDAGRDADTDWAQILALYDQLLPMLDTRAVRTARALAAAKVYGAAAGLALLPDDADDRYTLAMRGDLLAGLGRADEAAAAFAEAAQLATNDAERAHLLARERACSGMTPESASPPD